ncbi:hypothetical protein [Congregibacter litoralis]|uniref:Uncharacterized protein n=1 Tax=Congregibacter litoralis KT71 TaxID=314285 RepID=A4A7A5_9GAMM|nr:hypothetical protein [Congregibacter litoralis]EAQ98174.2 hypothetical protein KT71_02967 [Congregibacter litoralis KT71]
MPRVETSSYQLMKIHILNAVDLSKDAVHIYVGMAVFLITIIVWQRGRISWLSLIPVIAVATVMEALDLHDDSRSFGYLRWGASAHDLLNTVFWPTVIVLLAKLRLMR